MRKKEKTGIVIHSLDELKQLIEHIVVDTMLVITVEVVSDAA